MLASSSLQVTSFLPPQKGENLAPFLLSRSRHCQCQCQCQCCRHAVLCSVLSGAHSSAHLPVVAAFSTQ
jgi:hypothetical protein